MIPRSKNFRSWFAWFSDTSQEPRHYIDGCERVLQWLAEDAEGFSQFREELAAHIRDSSLPPPRRETQWTTDEWLRGVWFDAFGPEPPPDDPYPVPAEQWGRVRFTDYMLHAVDEDEEGSSDGAAEWLARHGLTAQGIHDAPTDGMMNVRPQPEDYLDRLKRLTEAGLREPQPGEPWYSSPA
ncbi:hypothetical protein [Jiangella asiatica]|uniref:Uncharacterized protein n=1 Tax=Jiangella asiatica TaxID=2530372 RepID=A0A4R5CJ66_9ACTN|nr:hypothetical protein [Jiangella asiatica]TDE00319.1 hypothetical protein E1269_25685 [Jiangella asiatica]